MAGGDRMLNGGYTPLNRGHDSPDNARQAPAAVRIGVTLLFSGSFSPVGAAISPESPRIRRRPANPGF